MRMLTRVGSAPPNGSRLSCGRPARRRKGVGRQSVPARAQHSASLKAITARQLQALVRRQRPVEYALRARRGRTAPRELGRSLGIPPPRAPPSPDTPADEPVTNSQVVSRLRP